MEDVSFWNSVLDFLKNNVINIVLIIAVATFLQRITNRFIGKIVEKTVRRSRNFKYERDEKAREDTLKSIFSATSTVLIWFIAVLLVLGELNINLGPLIAGAGIAGLAIGFGAQSLVKDVVNGTFILLENQYRVGDVVRLNQEVSGTVEDFTLRVTTLRDLDGMKHYIPNGEITLATNMTMEFSGINLDIGIDYGTDLEKLEKVINTVGEELSDDKEWKEFILEAPTFLRVDAFADSAIIVKITGKTIPMKQWAVTGELRKRLKIAFDKNGIEIPYPQRVIHQSPSLEKKTMK